MNTQKPETTDLYTNEKKITGPFILLPFGITLLIGSFFFLRLYNHFVLVPPVFTDLIIESVAKTGLNKAGEISLFRILAIALFILLCALGFLFTFLGQKTTKAIPANLSPRRSTDSSYSNSICYFFILLFALLIQLAFWKKMDMALLLGLIYLLCLVLFSHFLPGTKTMQLALPILLYYDILAALTVLMHFSQRFFLSQKQLYLLTIVVTALSLIVFAIIKSEVSYALFLSFLQLPLPLLLTIYFIDSYLYRGNLITVRYAKLYYVFFASLIFFLIAGAIWHFLSIWKQKENLPSVIANKLIGLSTVISVFIYNSYCAAPAFAQPDQHHHGEQLIPWQQIVDLSQTAYKEYTPVSGLFPLVNGFIQNVLLSHTVADYAPAIAITLVIFCVITATLIYLHVGGGWALLFAIFFALPSYNRQYMVLPLMLLLFLPKLRAHKGLWLKTWLLGCFLAGLYYPLYGAAVLVGTLPLAIATLIKYIKETDWQKQLKTPAFYLGWLLTLLPVITSLPLLYRIAIHTLTYSGQTILADGISLFGQMPPAAFLPYVTGELRQTLYLLVRFFLPMVFLWLFGYLFVWKIYATKVQKQEKEPVFLYAMLAGLLTLAISYSYTLVRADVDMMLSRTAPVLIVVGGIFLPVILLSLPNLNETLGNAKVIILCLSLSLPLMIYHQVSDMKFPNLWTYPNGEEGLLLSDSSKLFSHYEVPESFLAMPEIDIPDTSMLGIGFMVADQVSYLEQYSKVMEKCNQLSQGSANDEKTSICYLGFDGQGFYYYLNAKAMYTGFIQAGKSKKAQDVILSHVKEQRPVVFLLEPESNYYVYAYILSHDYVYVKEDGALYPKEIYTQLKDLGLTNLQIENDSELTETITSSPSSAPESPLLAGDDYRDVAVPLELGNIANSFGNSFDSLSPLFKQAQATYAKKMPATINGLTYDYLYIGLSDEALEGQLKGAKSLSITFTSDGQSYEAAKVNCLIGSGKLLIPMGMNPVWLLSENSNIRFTFLGEDGSEILICDTSVIGNYTTYDPLFLELQK